MKKIIITLLLIFSCTTKENNNYRTPNFIDDKKNEKIDSLNILNMGSPKKNNESLTCYCTCNCGDKPFTLSIYPCKDKISDCKRECEKKCN